ncbi:MAG: Unknown protein [uncultured Sulfurovum sp.]|uniref:Uncharacterized protein n=1 Tax=uncultured Sulfurovum sp. TaxID=269237 RepID=A0A6S6RZ69_9BACT|nr:MAG: Unknown protein [uncultured Sulfurovum sp.]
MYLWKIKNLKQEIIEGSVTSKDYVLYLTLFLALYMALFVQAIIQINSLWNMEMVVLQVIISILGIAYAYYNSKRKALFIKDFTSVGWVFLLRSLFFMSIGMLNLYVMTSLFGLDELFSAKNAIIVAMIFEILLYWRIGSHIASLKS